MLVKIYAAKFTKTRARATPDRPGIVRHTGCAARAFPEKSGPPCPAQENRCRRIIASWPYPNGPATARSFDVGDRNRMAAALTRNRCLPDNDRMFGGDAGMLVTGP